MFRSEQIIFPGYQMTEKIYSGSKTIVYRGIREKDNKAAIIKMMRNEYPSFSEIEQFRNQYSITKNLDLPGIVKPHSLENYRNGYALVMEDFGDISLSDYMISSKELTGKREIPITNFLHIGIQITSILDGLHRHRIIHKDIKPANILINPSTLELKLIDFSIASLLPREIQFLTSPNLLEGTLAYISPEQTGRMNRGIDYRSDFYSLGVTFFELLTGQLPFTTKDPMELIYCHIAKLPPNVSSLNPKIPPVLSLIISKLMAKNAEDRYQSALGFKQDLDICLKQWEETGKIASFEFAKGDISDRFLIPEKLYGRKNQVEKLLTTFHRVTQGTTEMLLVVGASGVGKTVVVNEVHKPIVKTSSYFIKGKFNQLERDIPLSGLVQAFKDLIGQLLSETDAQIQQWKTKIVSALGEQGQLMVDLIPKLELIIGMQPPVAELSGIAAQNRFNLLFQRFIHVFAIKEHPLVIFLDDLQWADAASLKLIQLLMDESYKVNKETFSSSPLLGETERSRESEGCLLLIGAYRDNEVLEAHPLCLTLNEIKRNGGTINTIILEALTQEDLNCLIADTLRYQEKVAEPLTKMVFNKTKGNSFFSHQFLKYLYNEGLIEFNFELRSWQCDLAKIQALSITDDVVNFLIFQLEKLPRDTQKVLKIAACIGNKFDIKDLAIFYQKSERDTAADLWTGLVEGLILPDENYNLLQKSENSSLTVDSSLLTVNPQRTTVIKHKSTKYKFVHDRVQQATYSLIPESQKQSFHLRIGRLLLSNISVEEQEERIFDSVNQFNLGQELLTDRIERDELAKMNLMAGRKAKASTAYTAALKYLTIGTQLLADDCWEKKYELTLALYETAAEVAYLAGDFSLSEQFVQVVLVQAKTVLDKVKVYEVKIQAYGAQNKALEAVNTALPFLKLLGVEFPENPSKSDVQRELERTAANLADRRIEDLIHLPEMTEVLPLAMMRILSNTMTLAYQSAPKLLPLILVQQINLSIQYGNAPLSAFGYVVYGFILCGVVGDIESGYQFGKLAVSLLSKLQKTEVTVKVIETFNQFIRPCKEHLKETLKPLLEVYSIGIETGDLEFAAYALYTYSNTAYFMGQELVKLEREVGKHSHAIRQIKQERMSYWNEIYRQTVLNLIGRANEPCYLIGEAYNEDKMLPLHLESNDAIALLYLYFCKTQLCYLFAEYTQALENAANVETYLHGGIGKTVIPQFHFYDSLARLAVYLNVEEFEQKQILEKIYTNQEKMQKWADHAPMNYLHKFYLVEAERNRVLGNNMEAMEFYDHALVLAKEHEYIHEEALANELAAKFYLEWGKQKIAQTYLTDAYYGYVRWGAIAKVDDLAKRYPQLLSPILPKQRLNIHPHQKNISSNSTTLSNFSDRQAIISSNTIISDSLDLATVIKASQVLSGQIELELLLSTLMEVVMENAGASKCALILKEGDNLKLTVSAVSSSSLTLSTEFPSVYISSSDVPVTLINYVKRTKEILVIDDAIADASIANDHYIVINQPKSLLCLPIINQSKLIGILYLENNLTTAAFTRDRIEVLKVLTTQAAICLENAILYNNLTEAKERLEEYSHTLEEKVTERTQELNEKNQRLQQALKDLQSTQTQLIQSEKMSSLGQMMAGIAHEINNPINFIHGNITHAHEYVADLLNLIDVYQQEYPDSSSLIQEKAEEIDLDFLVTDLAKLLDSMQVGSSRIRSIVLSLRNFSRLDEAEMKPVNIHEGIDNTLMILQHRLKTKSDRLEIQVIKEYGQLPEVACYAGQLNQVFMNILSNAIDALEEGVTNRKSGTGGGDSPIPSIRICTELVDDYTVRIRIADNGAGMSPQVQEKIFDPFFTTKPVGSGTGLGLSISYQIIVDKHKGKLICYSTLEQGTEFVVEIPMQQL